MSLCPGGMHVAPAYHILSCAATPGAPTTNLLATLPVLEPPSFPLPCTPHYPQVRACPQIQPERLIWTGLVCNLGGPGFGGREKCVQCMPVDLCSRSCTYGCQSRLHALHAPRDVAQQLFPDPHATDILEELGSGEHIIRLCERLSHRYLRIGAMIVIHAAAAVHSFTCARTGCKMLDNCFGNTVKCMLLVFFDASSSANCNC